MQTDLISEDLLQENVVPRKKLIPTWIRIFSWIFFCFGLIVPVGIIIGLLGSDFSMALYGFETNDIFSITGITIAVLFLLKGIVAYGLLWSKDWAVKLAMADSIIGILLCIYSMVFLSFTLRLELIALIPYLIKMKKISADWEAGTA